MEKREMFFNPLVLCRDEKRRKKKNIKSSFRLYFDEISGGKKISNFSKKEEK